MRELAYDSHGARGVLARAQDDAPSVALGPNRATFLLRGEDTGGRYSLTEFTMAAPPAPGPPTHAHATEDELLYVLDGDISLEANGVERNLGPGGVVLIPSETPHTLRNLGPGEARFLVLLTPPGFEGYWAEMGAILATVGGPPDPATTIALQEKYGMTTLTGAPRRFE